MLCKCYHCGTALGRFAKLFSGTQQHHTYFKSYDEIIFDSSTGTLIRVHNDRLQTPIGIKENPGCSATASGSSSSKFTNNPAISPATSWTDAAVKLLKTAYKDLQHKFASPQHKKKSVWGN